MIPTDSSSNNQMIVLSITPNLVRLKKKAFDITRLAEMTHQNWPKWPTTEMTQAGTTQGRKDSGPKWSGMDHPSQEAENMSLRLATDLRK